MPHTKGSGNCKEYLHIYALYSLLFVSLLPYFLFNIIACALIPFTGRETNCFLSVSGFFLFFCVFPFPFSTYTIITNVFLLLVFSPDANFCSTL